MTRKPVLLIDVMDTLVHDPFFVEVPRFFGLSLRELLECKHPTAWFEFESGVIDESTYLDRYFRDGRGFDRAGLKATLRAAYRWYDEHTEPLLKDLRAAGVAMHALSNYPRWYELIEERVRLSRYVAWTFVSCRTGLRKPSAEAFMQAARSLCMPPEQCLFIDDRIVNCDAARALGMDVVRFTDTPSLREELRQRGVLG